jgi:hypothetical protein
MRAPLTDQKRGPTMTRACPDIDPVADDGLIAQTIDAPYFPSSCFWRS